MRAADPGTCRCCLGPLTRTKKAVSIQLPPPSIDDGYEGKWAMSDTDTAEEAVVDVRLKWSLPAFILTNLALYAGGISVALALVPQVVGMEAVQEVGCDSPGVVVHNTFPITLSAVAAIQPQRYLLRYLGAAFYIASGVVVGSSWWLTLYRRQAQVAPRWLRTYRILLQVEALNLLAWGLGYLTVHFVMGIEWFFVHATGTWIYSIFGSSHMCTVTLLYILSGTSMKQNTSLRIKVAVAVLNILLMPLMLLASKMHDLCVPEAYTAFCVFEWTAFYLHQIFHATSALDFSGFSLVLASLYQTSNLNI